MLMERERMVRSPVTTLLSAIIFLVAAFTFWGAYGTYRGETRKMESLQVRGNLMARHQQRFEQQQQVIDNLDGFVAETARLGLDPGNWETYDVQIQEVVSFSEMKRIVNQCVNTTAYYFKPESLEAKKKVRNPKKILTRPADTLAEEELPDTDEGDILLNLRGTFVVKHK